MGLNKHITKEKIMRRDRMMGGLKINVGEFKERSKIIINFKKWFSQKLIVFMVMKEI
jgi:hypothetical protein